MTDSIKSFGISIAVSLIVFLLLAYIVKPDLNSLRDADDFRVVDFIRLKKDSSIKEKLRSIPDKPQPPKKPPPAYIPLAPTVIFDVLTFKTTS